MYSIAIIIPVHNRLEQTKECLQILKSLKDSPFFQLNTVQIIIVDDGSTDGTPDFIQSAFPHVIILQGDGNLWWSGSMNLGIKYALNELGCEVILLWENDIMPFPGYFDNLQTKLNSWDWNHIVCSKIFFMVNPSIIFAMGGIFNGRTGFKKTIGRLESDSEKYNKVLEVDWFCGQGIMIHKSIFAKVGYFDEKNFPQYHGDSDFALRAKKFGFKNLVYPDLKITNDTTTTGINHIKNKTLSQFIESLFSIRSNSNIIKDVKFYRRHTSGIKPYYSLIKSYSIYFGSFIKWKILSMFGIQKKYDEFY